MDAVTRVVYYFPTCSLTSFWILSNVIINNGVTCNHQSKSLIIAILVLFCLLVMAASFTDTYTASNEQKYLVLLLPMYGPLCFSLPTDSDKDRVYERYYLKVRDYVHAIISMTAFLLIAVFISPISMCLFNSGTGTSSLDASIVRTVPVVVALVTALIMMCLGPPRQMLGFQNVDVTCPQIEKQMGDNPIFRGSQQGPGSHMTGQPEGDEDEFGGMPPPNYGSKRGGPAQGNLRASNSMPAYKTGQSRAPSLQRGPDAGYPRESALQMSPRESMARQSGSLSPQNIVHDSYGDSRKDGGDLSSSMVPSPHAQSPHTAESIGEDVSGAILGADVGVCCDLPFPRSHVLKFGKRPRKSNPLSLELFFIFELEMPSLTPGQAKASGGLLSRIL